jgi:hypothetical protein
MKRGRPSKKRATFTLGLILALITLTVINQWLYAVKATNNHNYEQHDNEGPPVVGIVGTPKKELERLAKLEKFKQEKKRMEEPPKLVTGLPRRDDNNTTMSACLLVMDDNHFLIEWLAYHYLVMPLRYLIITIDPRSKTSPQPILDRWKDRMTIVQWSDKDFLPEDWLHKPDPDENRPQQKLTVHRERQRNFYPTCLQALRHVDRQWTTLTDIDEFTNLNKNFVNMSQTQLQPATIREAIDKYYGHVLDNTTCITIPRLLFGNYEEDAGKTIPKNDDNNNIVVPVALQTPAEQFLTLRWKYRAPLQSRYHNRMPKSMVDVSRIASYSRQETDAHRPVRSHCPRRNLYTLNRDSPLVIHHYIGSYEQFTFRDDARQGMKQRNDERFQTYGQIKDGVDVTITTWIQKFVKEVGISEAKRLLEGVGNVNFTFSLML